MSSTHLKTTAEPSEETQTRTDSAIQSKTITMADINQFWQTYHPRVFGYMYKRLNHRQDVEDLTNLVMYAFLDAMRNRPEQIKNPETYLWRIAHNQLARWIRDKYRQPITVSFEEDFELIDESLENFESENFQKRKQSLYQCLEKTLPAKELELVKQAMIDNIKSPVLAQQYGLSSANIRQKISRSLKKLRDKCQDIWLNYEA
jgi:RNA polymerase sigma factor (sigma-70 family)